MGQAPGVRSVLHQLFWTEIEINLAFIGWARAAYKQVAYKQVAYKQAAYKQ